MRITLSRGAEFEGVYDSDKSDSASLVLRMVQPRKTTGDIANGTAKRDQSSMSFQRKDVVDGRAIGGNPNKSDAKVQNGMTSPMSTYIHSTDRAPARQSIEWFPNRRRHI